MISAALMPSSLGHLHVHDHDVGRELASHRDRLFAVGGLPDHDHAFLGEEFDEIEPDECLVLGDEDPACGRIGGVVSHERHFWH